MIKKKNGFLTFLCSLIPGAGEMYLGFMKEGLSIMLLAFGIFLISSWLWMNWLTAGLVILWFYSFFNVHNKVSLPDEEFYTLEDDYLFHLDRIFLNGNLGQRQIRIFGWILVALGITSIWRPSIRNLLNLLRTCISPDFADVVGNYLYSIPRFVIAAVLIVCGTRLIMKKKIELSMEAEEESQTED